MPEQKVEFRATCTPEPKTGFLYAHHWKLVHIEGLNDGKDKIGQSVSYFDPNKKSTSTWSPKIEAGSYECIVTVSSDYPKPNGSKGEDRGKLDVLPG